MTKKIEVGLTDIKNILSNAGVDSGMQGQIIEDLAELDRLGNVKTFDLASASRGDWLTTNKGYYSLVVAAGRDRDLVTTSIGRAFTSPININNQIWRVVADPVLTNDMKIEMDRWGISWD